MKEKIEPKMLIIYNKKVLNLIASTYQNNGRIYLGLETENGELYADITINLSNLYNDDEKIIYINKDIEEELKNTLKKEGVISDTIQNVEYNNETYEMAFSQIKEIYNEYEKKQRSERIKRAKELKKRFNEESEREI